MSIHFGAVLITLLLRSSGCISDLEANERTSLNATEKASTALAWSPCQGAEEEECKCHRLSSGAIDGRRGASLTIFCHPSLSDEAIKVGEDHRYSGHASVDSSSIDEKRHPSAEDDDDEKISVIENITGLNLFVRRNERYDSDDGGMLQNVCRIVDAVTRDARSKITTPTSLKDINVTELECFENVRSLKITFLEDSSLKNYTSVFDTAEDLEVISSHSKQNNYNASNWDNKPSRNSEDKLVASEIEYNYLIETILAKMKALQHLDLSDNELEYIFRKPDEMKPVDGGTPIGRKEESVNYDNELTSLIMSGNNLPKLSIGSSLARVTKLKHLDVSRNRIADIDAGVFNCKLRNLEHVDLSSNQLTTLANFTFVDMTSLKLLNLSYNSIETIETNTFASVHAVTEECDDSMNIPDVKVNAIGDEPNCMDGRWPELETLDLSHNALRTLNEATFQRALCGVRFLRLGHNRIGHLPRYVVEQLRHLESIDLRHNDIAWLDVGTFTNPTLREINLSHNRLRKIISMTFLYLPAVASIDLSYNEIGYIYKYAFYRICKDERRLIRLSFRGNRLQTDGVWKILSIFQHQENSACAVEADVSDNQARQLIGDALDFVRRQIGVDTVMGNSAASGGGVVSSVGGRERLNGAVAEWKRFDYWRRMSIDLRDNQFNCECDLMEELEIILYVMRGIGANESNTSNVDTSFETTGVDNFLKNVGNCFTPFTLQGLSVVNFYGDTKLRQRCRLPFDICPRSCDCSQKILNCSRRGLISFPALSNSLDNITSIDLSFNNITVITAVDVNHEQIESLDVSHNQLQSIDYIALTQASNLKSLFLHDNQLVSLPQTILSLTRLRNITLRDNPLRCSRTCNFINTFKLLRGVIDDWDKILCADGRLLSDIVKMKSIADDTIDCTEHLASMAAGSGMPVLSEMRNDGGSGGAAAVVSAVANFHVLLVLILIIVLGIIALLAIRGQLKRNYLSGLSHESNIKRTWTNVDTLGLNGGVVPIQHDVFVSYSDADEAWVTGSLLEVIWNRFPKYCVCLQQHVDELHAGVTTSSGKDIMNGIQSCVENSQMTIVVLSKGFLATLLRRDNEGNQENNYRKTLIRNLDGQRHKFLFVFLESLDLDAFDAELSGYVRENTQVWAADATFADQLVCNLPHPLIGRTFAEGLSSRSSTVDSEKGLLLGSRDDGYARHKLEEKY